MRKAIAGSGPLWPTGLVREISAQGAQSCQGGVNRNRDTSSAYCTVGTRPQPTYASHQPRFSAPALLLGRPGGSLSKITRRAGLGRVCPQVTPRLFAVSPGCCGPLEWKKIAGEMLGRSRLIFGQDASSAIRFQRQAKGRYERPVSHTSPCQPQVRSPGRRAGPLFACSLPNWMHGQTATAQPSAFLSAGRRTDRPGHGVGLSRPGPSTSGKHKTRV